MVAFVNIIVWNKPLRGGVVQSKNPLRALIRPHKRRVGPRAVKTLHSTASEPQSEVFEDDDATMGEPGPLYGMTTPDLSEADKDYLDGATSDNDFMARMTEIARRIHRERRLQLTNFDHQNADDYLHGLSRPSPPPLGDIVHPEEGHQPYVNTAENYIDHLSDQSRLNHTSQRRSPPNSSLSSNSKPKVQPVEDKDIDTLESVEEENINTLESVEEKIARLQSRLEAAGEGISPQSTIEDVIALQKSLRQDLGLDEEASAAADPQNSEGIDKQIRFLEGYLASLEKGEVEGGQFPQDNEAASLRTENSSSTGKNVSNPVQPRIEGLSNTPDGMSAAEKMKAFEQVRRQAMNSSSQNADFVDPYNVKLPSRINITDEGDEPSPGSASEYDAIGSELASKDKILGEMEAEVTNYATDAKKLLQRHDARMQALIARLRVL